jgi:hypothetical protein
MAATNLVWCAFQVILKFPYLFTALLVEIGQDSWRIGGAEKLLGVTMQRKHKDAFDCTWTRALKPIGSDSAHSVSQVDPIRSTVASSSESLSVD